MKLFHDSDHAATNVAFGNGRSTILLHAFWIAIFGYFAFGYSKEPTSVLTSQSDDLIKYVYYFDGTDGEGFTVDVAGRFNKFFLLAFYIAALQFVALFSSDLFLRCHCSIRFMEIFGELVRLASIALFILWILAFYFRLSPSGRAACGDSLAWDADHTGYLYYQGIFIGIVFILFLYFILLRLLNKY